MPGCLPPKIKRDDGRRSAGRLRCRRPGQAGGFGMPNGRPHQPSNAVGASWEASRPPVAWPARRDPWRAARQAHTAGRCILVVMKPARAASRRFLPTSPFARPSAAPPEQFAVWDQVTHDTYGLGRVIGVEVDAALDVDFGSCRVRIMTPCAKLTKL